MQIDWSEKNIQEIELFFSTNITTGLDVESYKNARRQYGANIIKSRFLKNQNFYGLEKKKNNIKLLFSRAISIFGIIYIVLLLILNLMYNTYVNIYAIIPFLIFSIIYTLILIGNSEKKHSYLYKLCRPRALVIRNGRRKRVFIESLVPGDLLILSTGDIVPADARLVETNSMSCIEIADEKTTVHINKTHKILKGRMLYVSDEMGIINSNIVFATDIIISGSGLAVVIATGKNTRIIKTFGDLEHRETSEIDTSESEFENYTGELSHLQKDAVGITQKFSLISISFAMALLIFGILLNRDLESILLISFTVVASMFSDKLPVIADFAVMQGMINLAKKGILIKQSSTVDKLNNINTLISKKNETYIRGILKLQKIYYDHWDYDVTPKSIVKIGHILSYMALCVNVGEERTEKGGVKYTGLPVDVATAKAFRKCGLNFTGLYEMYIKYGKISYNQQSGNRNILVYSKEQNKFLLIYFGEAENIIRRCVLRETTTGYIPLDRRTLDMYKRKVEDLYKSYDVVMAVAVKEYRAHGFSNDESNLDFVGIISFSEADVLGVYENINYLKKSGISPVMIVDANNTATQRSAIRLGIVGNGKRKREQVIHDSVKILDDEKIARIDDGVFYANADKYKLFMSISIQNRIKFLKALRFRKKNSAITVNTLDELQVLNEADITFTPATVETGVLINKSSVILKNLSISEIINAIKGAVVIYKNVHNIISFAVSLFTAQYLLVFFALILDGRYLLNAVQMIWSGGIVGYMCAVAMCFGEDTNKWYELRNKLKNYKKYNKEMIKFGISTGVLLFFVVILSFAVCLIFEEANKNSGIIAALSQYIGSDKIIIEPTASLLSAQTGGFVTLIFACLTIALINIKSTHLSDLKIFENKAFIITAAGNIILAVIVMMLPVLRDTLGFAALSAKSIIFAVLNGIIIPLVYMLSINKSNKLK